MSDSEPDKRNADAVETAVLAAPESSDQRKAAPKAPMSPELVALLNELTVGRVIDGKYAIDKVIGRGAMGVVLAATHIHLKEKVALKFLSASANVRADDFHQRFRREAQVSAKLRNEHITRVIDVGVWAEKYPFMVMDLLVGDDLRIVMKKAENRRLDAGVALDYIVQVCEGLAEAHALGIVHRDLKPSNLFLTKRNDGSDLVKILDFGISKWADQQGELDELTQTGIVLGSPKYMAPEQLFGASEVDSRADVWSLGAIFYEALSGRPPYDFPTITRLGAALGAGQKPPSLKSLVPDLHPELEAVVMRCFAIERDDRIPNVAALAGELLEAIGAPFAAQVRQRIGAILDPKSVGVQLTTSGAFAIGAQSVRSLSMSTGSMTSLTSSAALKQLTDSGARRAMEAARTSTPPVPAIPASSRPSRLPLALAGLVALLAVVFAVTLLVTRPSGGDATRTAQGAPPPPRTAPTASTAAPPPVPVAAQPPVQPTPQPSAIAEAPVAPSASAAPVPPAPTPRRAPPRGGPAPRATQGAPPAAPQPAAAPVPPPAPAPAPAPPAPPKANPLDDRQ